MPLTRDKHPLVVVRSIARICFGGCTQSMIDFVASRDFLVPQVRALCNRDVEESTNAARRRLPEVALVRSFIWVSGALGLLLMTPSYPLMTASAVAATTSQPSAAPEADRTRDNVSVSRPTWHHGGGLLYGEVTIRNRNPYPVNHVIITCDFFDEWGNQISTKGVALGRPIPPGRTRYRGLEFSISVRKQQGGACRTLSAERMEAD